MTTNAVMPVMETTVVDGVTKFSISFGLTDEEGQPILDRHQKQKMTNIIADTAEELVAKLATANLEVARALNRSSKRFETLSNSRPTAAAAPVKIQGKPLTEEERVQAGLDIQDPRKAAAAVQRVVESVVPVSQIATEIGRQGEVLSVNQRKEVAIAFFRANPDYLPIEANNALLNRFLLTATPPLAFTVENLEFAAASIAEKLVARPRPSVAPNNAPPPSPDNDLEDDEEENAPPNPGTPPTQQRRTPASGISNSQASGRPTGSGKLTRAQVLEMSRKDPKKYEAWMKDPVKNAILNAALAGR